MKMNIKEKIIKEVENKALKIGAIGKENVSITLTLTDEEKKEFLSIELGENYSYSLGGNMLDIVYSEEI